MAFNILNISVKGETKHLQMLMFEHTVIDRVINGLKATISGSRVR